jgi:hypothetical protein
MGFQVNHYPTSTLLSSSKYRASDYEFHSRVVLTKRDWAIFQHDGARSLDNICAQELNDFLPAHAR